MKWIRALDLERWAATIGARELMAALVGDLIRATAPEIRSFRFPNGDKGQVRGFDGWLEATGMPPYVPSGLSLWEFGVSGEKPPKALSDYTKRVGEVDANKRADTTFVFVSPETWDNPREKLQDWLQARKDEKYWKDVLYIDGSQLEDWLSERPAVSARYAHEMGLRPLSGVRSSQDFWDEYAHRFKSKLTEEVVLASRSKQAADFLQSILAPLGAIELAADSPDEVIAFAIAAIRKADPETRVFLEDRILVLDTEEAARHFSWSTNAIYFPRSQANSLSGLLATKGPTLVAKGRDLPTSKHENLERPSTSDFATALETMGLETNAAYNLARYAGRSITVLARRYPGGNVQRPEWQDAGRSLVPAMIAGGWDAANAFDQNVVSSLAGGNAYSEFERILRSMSKLQDPPIDLEGPVWKMRAPVDIFVHLGHLVSSEDLTRLRAAATDVFSRIDAPPQADDPFVLPHERPLSHSSWLRDGLANTLLQFAVLHDQAEVNVPGVSPQSWVNDLVRSLPGLRENHRLIASLRDELWLLMEAAPIPLLEALEQLLEGDATDASMLFSKDDAMFSPTSPHNYILWALETVAWDPTYLDRASILIAKLADIDRGGSASNRPIDSLRTILLPWSPNTNANLSQRNAVVTEILQRLPDVGWSLLLLMLPRSHDTSSPTRKPRFREAGASRREILTYAIVWDAQAFVIDSVLDHIGNDSSRWCEVIERIDEWTAEQQLKALSAVDKWLSEHGDRSAGVWKSLNDLANKHIAFSDTDWALPSDMVKQVLALVRKHEPDDPISRYAWLFESWSPQMGGKFEDNETLAEGARQDAVTAILNSRGADGLFALIDQAKEPALVGLALSHHLSGLSDVLDYTDMALAHAGDNATVFARVISAKALERFGGEWKSELLVGLETHGWSEQELVQLVLSWPDSVETWAFVGELGSAVETAYWTQKRSFQLTGSLEEAVIGIDRYLQVGRAQASIVAAQRHLNDVPTSTIVAMLNTLVGELNRENRPADQMMGYYIDIIFSQLDTRSDITRGDIARLEYVYLPLLDDRNRRLAIHELMAEDSAFYMSLIESVFRSDKDEGDTAEVEPATEVSKKSQAKARQDYRLLSQFSALPGAGDGDLNFEALSKWVLEVRSLARRSRRAAITDVYIGHLLAHAPVDPDGGWPHRSVRRLLQELKSTDVERGIYTERYNMRGAYSKSIYEGGVQERDIAARNREWAALAADYPRTAQLLEKIAEGYDRDAEREDERAALDKLRD